MTDLLLQLGEARCGASIQTCAAEAQRMALILGVDVEFVFNDVKVWVQPGQTVDYICRYWLWQRGEGPNPGGGAR